jgi:hypothetical protein
MDESTKSGVPSFKRSGHTAGGSADALTGVRRDETSLGDGALLGAGIGTADPQPRVVDSKSPWLSGPGSKRNTARDPAVKLMGESDARLGSALRMCHAGLWELDLVDHTAHRTVGHDQVFGYETLLPLWTYEMFLEHVLTEDRAYVDRHFREALATQGRVECRMPHSPARR